MQADGADEMQWIKFACIVYRNWSLMKNISGCVCLRNA
jgi:hypothetical protein